RYVAFVGALGERVAWDTFLHAFASVAATRPDATLLVVGDGGQEKDVDALVEELGLGGRVIRTGHVDPERVASLTGAATGCLGASARRAAEERWSWYALTGRIVPLLDRDPS